MQTKLIETYQVHPEGQEAEEILRACVHCGFCNATCPTYQVLGNELDGPRGRIYLIKQLLEGHEVTAKTRQHLDRCLTCQSCETTCPSGVRYHHLLNIGRALVDEKVERPFLQRVQRKVLGNVLTRTGLFSFLLAAGRLFRPLLPSTLKQGVPLRENVAFAFPVAYGPNEGMAETTGKVFLHTGCVQDAIAPEINQATQIVFSALGFDVSVLGAGCCGAIEYHLDAQDDALARMKRNIDMWWQQLEREPEAKILSNASGCGAFLKDYRQMLRLEPEYLERAQQLVERVSDPVELVNAASLAPLVAASSIVQDQQLVAFQSPCSLQHGQKLAGSVEALLAELGVQVQTLRDGHLCCGSAGTYSILQADLSRELKSRKLESIAEVNAKQVVTANIGCQTHLNSDSELHVRHWLVMVAEMLTEARSGQSDL